MWTPRPITGARQRPHTLSPDEFVARALKPARRIWPEVGVYNNNNNNNWPLSESGAARSGRHDGTVCAAAQVSAVE